MKLKFLIAVAVLAYGAWFHQMDAEAQRICETNNSFDTCHEAFNP